jgi:phage FluMu gp28-like protein
MISTHNGKSCRYYKFLEAAKLGKIPWAYHFVDIHKAVEQGYLDKIMGRSTTPAERAAWLAEEQAATGDESVWLQEYCCTPVDESTAWLTFDLIKSCEVDDIARIFKAKFNNDKGCIQQITQELEVWLHQLYGDNDTLKSKQLFVGVDIGRNKDLTVIWLLEKIGSLKYTRGVIELACMPYTLQENLLDWVFARIHPKRACFDATGLGDMLSEKMQEHWGKYRVEKIKFTRPVKEELATGIKHQFEDRLILIPANETIRTDLHAIQKLTTTAGNVRFDAKRSEIGHADRFWALALALHATSSEEQPIINIIRSSQPRSTTRALRDFLGENNFNLY